MKISILAQFCFIFATSVEVKVAEKDAKMIVGADKVKHLRRAKNARLVVSEKDCTLCFVKLTKLTEPKIEIDNGDIDDFECEELVGDIDIKEEDSFPEKWDLISRKWQQVDPVAEEERRVAEEKKDAELDEEFQKCLARLKSYRCIKSEHPPVTETQEEKWILSRAEEIPAEEGLAEEDPASDTDTTNICGSDADTSDTDISDADYEFHGFPLVTEFPAEQYSAWILSQEELFAEEGPAEKDSAEENPLTVELDVDLVPKQEVPAKEDPAIVAEENQENQQTQETQENQEICSMLSDDSGASSADNCFTEEELAAILMIE